jgi:putative oxygen-independent coproporphyrinogen III oxidase
VIRHLYVHIPFCPKLCPYCSFYSEVSDRAKTQRFLDALLIEIERQAASCELRLRTIFFGGGTPSALSTAQLDYLLNGLRARVDLADLAEWTLEMNPATVSLEKAMRLRDLGVNRISMGVQSWDEKLLGVLGRVHDAAQAERSYEILREAGFENVNLDLMFAVPTQTLAQWQSSLEKTVALAPEHISAYCLTYEEDTEFFAKFQSGEFAQDENWDADLFETTMDVLGATGYEQYEISNHARPGRECLHNLAYWTGADYLGVGPSAFSTVGARRWQNVPNADEYSNRIFAGEPPISFEEKLTPATRLAEAIAFSLRTNRGVERSVVEPWREQVEEFLSLGFLQPRGDRFVLTRKGRLLADSVAEAFV